MLGLNGRLNFLFTLVVNRQEDQQADADQQDHRWDDAGTDADGPHHFVWLGFAAANVTGRTEQGAEDQGLRGLEGGDGG